MVFNIFKKSCKHNWIETSIHPMYRTEHGKYEGIYLGTVRKCLECGKLQCYYVIDSSISLRTLKGFRDCSPIEEEYINEYAVFTIN